MKEIVVIGAGGLGREIQWLIGRMNKEKKVWNFLGYIDDGIAVGTKIDDYFVLGNSEYLLQMKKKLSVVCAVANVAARKRIIEKISDNHYLEFPNLIDPSVMMSERIDMGKGNLICASNILTVDIQIGDFNIINWDCTIGHDVRMASYITLYPSVNISGCVTIGSFCEIGTGAQIIQGKNIVNNVIIGAGSTVVKDLRESGTYVGIPARKMKDRKENHGNTISVEQ